MEDGETKYKCPILGCFYQGSFSVENRATGYRNHLKSSHAHCVDMSRVTVFGESRNLVYDIEHQVLVCLDQQVIILKNQLVTHQNQCSLCKDIQPFDIVVTQSLDMETDSPVQGLKWKLGTMCTHFKEICSKYLWANHKPCQKLGFEKADISYQDIRG